MKPYRAKNLVNTLRKTERILREAGLPANAVPTRLLFPICQDSAKHINDVRERIKNLSKYLDKEMKDRICDGMVLAPWAFGGFRSHGGRLG